MQIKEILIGIPVLLFIFYVFSAPVPEQRISRVCEPINWVGNLATSTTALTADSHTKTTVRWSDKLNYSCQYMIWRLFYQEAYNEAVQDGRVTPLDAKEEKDEAAKDAPPSKPESKEKSKAEPKEEKK